MKAVVLTVMLSLSLFAVHCGKGEAPSSPAELPTIRAGALNGPTAISLLPLLKLPPPEVISGRRTEFIIKNSPLTLRPALLQEELDIAVLPAAMAVLLYNKGLPYRAAAITVQGSLFLTGGDASVQTWRDLRGKKVWMMGKGATPDALFRILLQKNGLIPDNDVELLYTFPDPADLAQAAAAGQTPLAILSEPMNSLSLKKNRNLRIIMDLREEWEKSFGASVPLAQSLLVFHDDFLKRDPQSARQFMDRYKNALEEVVADPVQAGKTMQALGLAPAAEPVAAAIPNCRLAFVALDQIPDGFNAWVNIMMDYDPNLLGGKAPDGHFICRPK